jgi:enterochelin esterase-like enzyme
MRFQKRFAAFSSFLAVGSALLLLSIGTILHAGEVLLKNGMRLEGSPVAIAGLTTTLVHQTKGPTNTYPVIMVDTGMKRYFIHRRGVQEVVNSADLSRYETFELKQPKRGRNRMPAVVGAFSNIGPFDEYGRRTVTLRTKRGPVDIVQGITEITPNYLKLNGVTHNWEYAIATKSVPEEILDRVIRKIIDPTNPDNRMAVLRFYTQAGRYSRAFAEIESIVRDFLELKPTLDDVTLRLRKLYATELLHEVQRRRSAGQHLLAVAATKRFPTKRMSEVVLREVREMAAEYNDAHTRTQKARMLLGDLQSQLKDQKLINSVMPMRSVVSRELDYETLERLEAFLQFAGDETLSAKEKLAMAYSGWIMGSTNAVTDLEMTVRLWEARFTIREYLRTDDTFKQQDLMRKLRELEGVDATKIAGIIPLLPPLIETPGIQPGKVHQIEISEKNSDSEKEKKESIKYSVLLPPEYNPHHRYPLVVTLRPSYRSAEKQIAWWGGSEANPGQSQRHGYVVIAPEYLEENQKSYNYSTAAHNVVIQSIRDARKRFNIDSDRLFLSGHGMGGDAAFDIGMSHPDLFAGVIPITGISDQYCKWYWSNAKHVAWYVVGGERDRNSLERNSRDLYRMMQKKFDVLYAEYIARGYESYHEEIENLFDWMDLHRRAKYIKTVEAKVLRPSDNRFYWIKTAEFASNVTQSTVLKETRVNRVSPMGLKVKVTSGNTIIISRSAAKRITLFLSPEIVDFEKKVIVKIRTRNRYNDFLDHDISVMLDDFRLRGDRQKLYWAKLEF